MKRSNHHFRFLILIAILMIVRITFEIIHIHQLRKITQQYDKQTQQYERMLK